MLELGLLLEPSSHLWGSRGTEVCICMWPVQAAVRLESKVKGRLVQLDARMDLALWKMRLTAPLHLKSSNTRLLIKASQGFFPQRAHSYSLPSPIKKKKNPSPMGGVYFLVFSQQKSYITGTENSSQKM